MERKYYNYSFSYRRIILSAFANLTWTFLFTVCTVFCINGEDTIKIIRHGRETHIPRGVACLGSGALSLLFSLYTIQNLLNLLRKKYDNPMISIDSESIEISEYNLLSIRSKKQNIFLVI